MRQIRSDLWETRQDSPFPGLRTHAYLWTGGRCGNVLFYSTQSDADFAELRRLGGVAHQYLSHRDEAGPMLGRIGAQFGAKLHAPVAELDDIAKHTHVDVPVSSRQVDANGIEVIPTPGHSPGSTCYLVPGANGQEYLFTGDTIYLGEDGRWAAGHLPGISDAAQLQHSLQVLGTLHPDLVISSAFASGSAVQVPGPRWAQCTAQARDRLAQVA